MCGDKGHLIDAGSLLWRVERGLASGGREFFCLFPAAGKNAKRKREGTPGGRGVLPWRGPYLGLSELTAAPSHIKRFGTERGC